jgi:hypothetical protein
MGVQTANCEYAQIQINIMMVKRRKRRDADDLINWFSKGNYFIVLSKFWEMSAARRHRPVMAKRESFRSVFSAT